MIKIENLQIFGLDAAIRGMRNPMNSWDQSDSHWVQEEDTQAYLVGDKDETLMHKLALAGSDHAKYRRMITVYMDITAPLYWWKEFDTYKVGTVANSCSTMHKIASKEFALDDFSHEHLTASGVEFLNETIHYLNESRDWYLKYDLMSDKDRDEFAEGINCKKDLWWQMIQMLPSSYNQKRTVMLNFEVLANMHHGRRHHKLDEWQEFCDFIEEMDQADIICTRKPDGDSQAHLSVKRISREEIAMLWVEISDVSVYHDYQDQNYGFCWHIAIRKEYLPLDKVQNFITSLKGKSSYRIKETPMHIVLTVPVIF